MALQTNRTDDDETYRPAFSSGYPHISYGLPFHIACKKHINQTFKANRIYLIASGSLARDTEYVKLLQDELGNKLVGTRYGMKPHTLWSEILEVTKDAKQSRADLLITIGAGSLTDGAKIVSLVRSMPPLLESLN